MVRIKIDGNKYPVCDRALFRSVVKAAFGNRRKTLVNNLMMSFGLTRASAEEAVALVKGDVSARGETLSTADFVKLTELLAKSGTF